MRLVVFDLDHTLLTANSSFRFGSFLYRQKRFSFWTLLACLSDYAKHKWLGMSMHALHKKAFTRLFKGQALIDIRQQVDHFLSKYLASLICFPVLQRLRKAQEQGDEVIILSSSPDFLVGEIAQRLQVEHWKATTYETNPEGKFVTVSRIMEGHEKAFYVQALALQMQLPSEAITVYSDSYLDLPVLQIAGQPIGVAPDSYLKRICLQKGWEIL